MEHEYAFWHTFWGLLAAMVVLPMALAGATIAWLLAPSGASGLASAALVVALLVPTPFLVDRIARERHRRRGRAG